MSTVAATTGDLDVGWPELVSRLGTLSSTLLRHGSMRAANACWRACATPPLPDARGQWLADMLNDLGPTFIKGGQLLSTRGDLLSAEWCATLGQLHAGVVPMTTAHAQEATRRAYRERAWPFAEFDWNALASGSIACVYWARLHSGRAVAVKVRRPRIRSRMRADVALLGKGARVIQRMPAMRKVPAQRIVEQIGFALLRQLDLAAEASSLAALRANLTGLEYFRIPEPLPRGQRRGCAGDGVHRRLAPVRPR